MLTGREHASVPLGWQDQDPDAAGGVIYLTAAASPDLTGEAAIIDGRVIIGMTKIRQ